MKSIVIVPYTGGHGHHCHSKECQKSSAAICIILFLVFFIGSMVAVYRHFKIENTYKEGFNTRWMNFDFGFFPSISVAFVYLFLVIFIIIILSGALASIL